jgi:hypothetical protein
MFVLPSIPDDATTTVKNALAARNVCATEGRCPECGCVGHLEPVEPRIFQVNFEHEPGCIVIAEVAT